MIVLNPFLDFLCNFGFKNIGLTPGIPKGCFQHPQDVVLLTTFLPLVEFDEGISSRGIINMAKYSGHNLFETLFPFYPFTKWVIQNFGINTFFRNFDILFKKMEKSGFGYQDITENEALTEFIV